MVTTHEYIEFQELPRIEKLRTVYSDVYKEVHGIRPRHFMGWSEQELEDWIEWLLDELEQGEDETPTSGEGWQLTTDS